MKEFKIESRPRCPSCRDTLEAASCASANKEQEAPEPGDFSVCLCCGEIMRFTDEMQLKSCDQNDFEVAKQHSILGELYRVSKLVMPIAKIIQEKRARQN